MFACYLTQPWSANSLDLKCYLLQWNLYIINNIYSVPLYQTYRAYRGAPQPNDVNSKSKEEIE